MKKSLLLLITIFTITVARAQLENTRWKGRLMIDGPVNTIFDFKKDSVSLYTLADSTIIETMKYTSDGSSVTVFKIDGQSDCDNSTPGNYNFKIENGVMVLNLVTDGCDERAAVIDTSRWTKWRDHIEVQIGEAVLKQYAGVYQLDPEHPITISYENGKLYAEGPNNNLPKSPLMAESPTKFFLRIAGVEWDFVKDASGKVTKLISHEEKDYELPKVK